MKVLQETRIAPDRLEAFARNAFVACGVRAAIAADTASGLCFASLRGTDSHGIFHADQLYVSAVRVRGTKRRCVVATLDSGPAGLRVRPCWRPQPCRLTESDSAL